MLKQLLFSVIVLCLACSCLVEEHPVKITAGISEELAVFRKKQVENVVYNLEFDIPLEKEDPIPAELTLQLDIVDLSQALQIDFKEERNMIHDVQIDGISIDIHFENNHIIVSKELLKEGRNVIMIKFTAGELSLNRNKDFLYTLLVPDRASTVFPCFDQPDIKAKYQLTVSAPENWKVLTSSVEVKSTTQDKRTRHEFGLSDPMSTYLFSFVAGVFQEAEQGDMYMLYRENNEEKIAESIDPIFNVHQQSLDFLEGYANYDFAFQKLDFASIPGFQYGGMEHVGAIQYRESALFLVNDVWMKEVFANFMADKIMNPAFPEINHDLQFNMSHFPRAYSEDRTQGTNPIRQQLPNLNDAGSLYGAIIYNKAPIMMRQLELLLGKEEFKLGIQKYIKQYAHGNADWPELIGIFAGDTKQWSEVWVNNSGRPVFTEEIKIDNGKISSLEILQSAEDGSSNIWPQTFSIGLDYGDTIQEVIVQSHTARTLISAVENLAEPDQIIYNYDGYGYGVFPTSKGIVTDNRLLSNEVARGYGYINAYENMLLGNLEPSFLLGQFLNGINEESNELILNYLTGIASEVFWKYLYEKERVDIQADMKAKLWGLLNADKLANVKKTIFGLYRSIAYTEDAKQNLYEIWKKDRNIENLKLNENDYANIAASLAIFGHEASERILSETTDRISNPDRKERFNWLKPTLSSDPAVRDAFMISLKNEEMREKESWVGSALGYIHHPLRQSESIKHFSLCLELIEEIQMTGDIFFPKRWLSSSVGNYSSSDALEILENFLDSNPDFSPVLKKKLLQAADPLYKAKKIKG